MDSPEIKRLPYRKLEKDRDTFRADALTALTAEERRFKDQWGNVWYEVVKEAPDQMLAGGLMGAQIGRVADGPINASAMIAIPVPGEPDKWRFFSNVVPVRELIKNSSQSDIDADLFILDKLFLGVDKTVGPRSVNAQFMPNTTGGGKVSYFDFERFARFWRDTVLFYPILNKQFEEKIIAGMPARAGDRVPFAASLAIKLVQLHEKWNGNKGLRALEKLVKDIPKVPVVLSSGMPEKYQDLPLEQRIELFQREFLKRILVLKRACERAQIHERQISSS